MFKFIKKSVYCILFAVNVSAASANPLFFNFELKGRSSSDTDYLYKGASEFYQSSLFFNPLSLFQLGDGQLSFFSPLVYTSFLSHLPRNTNDGSLWQGPGVNLYVQTGFIYESPWLDIMILPDFWYAQNRDFEILEPYNWEFNHVYMGLDQYQRPGDSYVVYPGLGQSSLTLKAGNMEFSVAHESFILGPAKINPLIMSFQASALPHLRLGYQSGRKKWGALEVQGVWGITSESDFFDDTESNNDTLYTLFVTSYSPFFLPELTLGFNRVAIENVEDTNWYSYCRVFLPSLRKDLTGLSFGKDTADQRMSVTFSLDLEKSGVQVYGEFAKNDFSPSFREIMLIPEHSSGYTLGIRKMLLFSQKRSLSFLVEISDLIESRDYQLGFHGGGTFYSHHEASQGYTHRGQLLGAPMGSGSDSHYFSIIYEEDRSLSAELYVQRISFIKDYIYRDPDQGKVDGGSSIEMLNVEVTGGVKVMHLLDQLNLYGDLGLSLNMNNNYEKYKDIWNFYCALGITF